MDIFTKKKRSEVMRAIRSRGTGIELAMFRELRRRGVHFQRHYRSPVCNVDIALPSRKKAVFIDGDFWHGYRFAERKAKLPKRYWLPKIEENIRRDRRMRARLRRIGWGVLRVWEHEVKKDAAGAAMRIVIFLRSKK